jgi:hypothetical protein
MGKKKGLNTAEIEQIKVLSAAGYTHYAISKEVNRDHKTVKRALEKPEVMQEVKVIKLKPADKFENLANTLVDSVSPEVIEKMGGYQRIVGSGIATDKMRLLRDLSTSNLGLNIVEQMWATKDQLQEIDKRLLELRGAGAEVVYLYRK